MLVVPSKCNHLQEHLDNESTAGADAHASVDVSSLRNISYYSYIDNLASIPGSTSLREVGLVSTACACANIPPVSGGFGKHRICSEVD